jgi:hypothetical protein
MQLMSDYVGLIKNRVQGTMMTPDMNQMVHYRNLAHHQLLSLPPAEALGAQFTQLYPRYEACRLAALIFGIGVTFPLPVWAAPFPRLVVLLRESLMSLDLQVAWNDDLPLLLWILMLAGIAAIHLPDREWLVSALRDVISRIRLVDWEKAKAMLGEVLWLDSACEVGGRTLWDNATQLFQT